MTTRSHQYVNLIENDLSLLRGMIDENEDEDNISVLNLFEKGGTTSAFISNHGDNERWTKVSELRKTKTARQETHDGSVLVKIGWKSDHFESKTGLWLNRLVGFDETGGLRVTAFAQSAQVLFESTEVNKVYELKNLTIKKAHPWFNSMTHPLEATFDLNVSSPPIEYHGDTNRFPDQMSYNLTKFSDIATKYQQVDKVQCCIEMMGVCIKAGPVQYGKWTTRFITLVDDTNVKVDILLWGDDCEKFDLDDNPVVLLWGVQVQRTYKGQLVLNVQRCHDYIHEPDFDAANALRDW